jgi:hypothetical protein
MAWDFETDAEYQAQLDWADAFVRDEVEPLDLVVPGQQYVPPDERLRQVIDPLKEEVRKRRLWATHLGPELGGEGHGQLKLSLLNEILGRMGAAVMGIADGPTEVHKVTVARLVLRGYSPSDDLWPSQHIPRRLAAAREKYAEYLEHEVGNL